MPKSVLLLVAGLLIPAIGASSAFDTAGWRRFRDIHIPPHVEAGLIGVPLESAIMEISRPDLGDLRVVSSESNLIPITVVDSFHADEPKPFAGLMFKVTRRPGKWTDVWIDKKAKILTRGVTLQSGSKDFARKVEIRGSDNVTEEYVIHMDGLILDVPGPVPVRNLELLHPLNNFRYIHLRIFDGDQPPIKLEGALLNPPRSTDVRAESIDVRVLENRANKADRSTVLVIDLGEKRFPVAGIRISTPTKGFVKRLRITGGPTEPVDASRALHEGAFFRIERAEAEKESLEARFEPQVSRYLKIELTGTGPTVQVTSVEAIVAMRVAVFEFRPGVTYRLFYDRSDAGPMPTGPPGQSINLHRVLAASSDVTLGPEQKNASASRPRQAAARRANEPSFVWKIVGVAMLLVGLLLLFSSMLKARSQRKAERRRNARWLGTGL